MSSVLLMKNPRSVGEIQNGRSIMTDENSNVMDQAKNLHSKLSELLISTISQICQFQIADKIFQTKI